MLYIGCPMWGYKAWVGNFFPAHTPQSDFLHLYSRRLTTVEGNTTFYATPSVETIARWRQETPPEFRFCPKISRDISHSPQLDARKNETHVFTERMRGLGERLGPMLVRHPQSFNEPYTSELNTLLRRYQVARVIMDSRPIRIGSAEEKQVLQARERKPDLPVAPVLTADIAFVRYIGHPRMEVNEPLLDRWAQQMAQWLKQGITLYVFCHCPFEVHSPEICLALYQRVKALVSLPPLPGQAEQPEQGRLF